MTSDQIRSLQGQTVLVKPAVSNSPNSVGMRGSVRVIENSALGGEPQVEIVLNFPEMFNEPTHERVITLSPDEVKRLLASDGTGTYQLEKNDVLDTQGAHNER